MSQNITDHDIISRLPRAPEKRSIPALHSRLIAAGHQITMRSLQRRLISLMRAHPIVCDDSSKPYGWSISADTKLALGELSVQEAVALKLSERYLREAMPEDLLSDLNSYFVQANSKLKHESLYSAWLEKVRMVPANQPLRKPEVARNILEQRTAIRADNSITRAGCATQEKRDVDGPHDHRPPLGCISRRYDARRGPATRVYPALLQRRVESEE